MSLIYITGISGSGKSTVLRELAKQGYEAHGVDEEGYADWIDLSRIMKAQAYTIGTKTTAGY